MSIHIRWTDSEWLFFAMELAKIRPEVLRPGRYIANLESLRAAMAKMPPERQRPFPERGGLNGFRDKLQQIYDDLRASLSDDPEFMAAYSAESNRPQVQAQTTTSSDDEDWRHKPRTKWRNDEYDAMARVMLAKRPDITTDDLSLHSVREAMEAAIEPPRQRTLYSITPLRHHFEDAFARVRAEPKPLAVPPPPQYGPLRDVTPVQQDATQYSTGPYDDEDVPLTYEQLDHTQWEPHEWRLVAEELNRRYPEAQFRHDPELTQLTPEKLMVAQRVLPPKRRRMGFFGLTRPKDALWEEFSKMPGAATITAVPAPTSVPEPEDEELPPQPPAAPPPQEAALQAPANQAQQQAPAPLFAPATMVHNGVDPLRAALTDMAKIFADALAQSLRPVLRELVVELRAAPAAPAATPAPAAPAAPAVQQPTTAPAPPAMATPPAANRVVEQPPAPPTPPHIHRPPAPKPHIEPPPPKKAAPPAKPLVGIVGAQPIQERMLEASYPQLKFEFGDKHQKIGPLINSLRNCVRVIAMGQYMTKSHLDGLADHFKHRFAKVMGSGSSVKHQLDLWLHQGVLNEHYVANGDDGEE